jgi:predicted alpha/beta hydrolase family esterase
MSHKKEGGALHHFRPDRRADLQPHLIVPGWAGSGATHWQTHWERELPNVTRLEVPDWHQPCLRDWLRSIDDAIRRSAAPPIVIAHSLGCVAIARWAATAQYPVRGALLVAPADVDRTTCSPCLRAFAPIPRTRLPFFARVIASDDDPYADLARSRQIAADWGAELTVLHRAGHINVDAGYGPWPEGRAWIAELARPEPRAPDAGGHLGW